MSRVNRGVQARELREHTIAEEFHDPATLFRHQLLGDTLEGPDQREREVFIARRQSRIPRYIRKKDGSESTLVVDRRGWSLGSRR